MSGSITALFQRQTQGVYVVGVARPHRDGALTSVLLPDGRKLYLGWANESMDPLHVRTSRFLPRTGCGGMARGSPVLAACVGLAGTADGFDKETAVSRAQRALDEYIQQCKAENNLDAVTVSAMRAEPQPYWRGRVSENMMYHSDIVTAKSYTVCWQGVVSTYVCTSGAQVCW